jgi:long-chain-fatty-acid---luciferin-component ligase
MGRCGRRARRRGCLKISIAGRTNGTSLVVRPTPSIEAVEITRLRARDYDSLDQMLYEGSDAYHSELRDQRCDWIVSAVRDHIERSAIYRRLAYGAGFDVAQLEATRNLASIPLISSGSFKRNLFGDLGRDVKRCTSSGTMGTQSVVPRDARTLERFVGSISHGLREFLGHNDSQRAYILGPPREEAGDLWFAFSLSLTELFNDADYFVHADQFEPERLYEALQGAETDDSAEPVIASPPSLLIALLDWMEERGAPNLELARRNGWSVTAGGWKRARNGKIDQRPFAERMHRLLGLEPNHIRDVFNMVELNTIIFECASGSKHVPPWLSVTARSARDLTVLEPGNIGVLAYLDPTPLSYPGFILSDDLGTLSHDPCPCGRLGATLQLERRLTVVEERGCGLKMERYATGDTE